MKYLVVLFVLCYSAMSFAAEASEPSQSCTQKIQSHVSDMFESQSNRNYSVKVSKVGDVEEESYGFLIKRDIFLANLGEESGGNLYLVVVNQKGINACDIESVVEAWSSDNSTDPEAE